MSGEASEKVARLVNQFENMVKAHAGNQDKRDVLETVVHFAKLCLAEVRCLEVQRMIVSEEGPRND